VTAALDLLDALFERMRIEVVNWVKADRGSRCQPRSSSVLKRCRPVRGPWRYSAPARL